ncbi:GntR family transcriptional regulator [Niallia oryzisoli]|uniref:GntR family transcriptional regulator n=1 Tax=Niallia oryzisoli TaxID=1737571 RepID=UPI003735D525
MSLKIDQSKTLQNQVYEYLHSKIVNGEIQPGERIVEESIAKETGISRSPIREAIRRLDSVGLVSVSPRGGVRVYRPTFSDFKYLYECRLSLESTAAHYAAIRINPIQKEQLSNLMNEMQQAVSKQEVDHLRSLSTHFHNLIVQLSGNPYLDKMMKHLISHLTFYRNAVLNIPKRLEEGSDEHQAIGEAIIAQDPKAAEELMKLHIERDYQFYISKYSNLNPETSLDLTSFS